MKRYIPTITSTHNGKLLIVNEPFTADEKGFRDIDIHCLLNNGRIRIDTTFVEPEIKNIPVVEVKAPITVEDLEDKEKLEEKLKNLSDKELLETYNNIEKDIEKEKEQRKEYLEKKKEIEERIKKEKEEKENEPKRVSYIKKIEERKKQLKKTNK